MPCGDWKPYYLWFPRRFDGKWRWRITMFRRKCWNAYDQWYEYSFLPIDDAPVYIGGMWPVSWGSQLGGGGST